MEELDIDVAPAPCTPSRGAAKLQVFIARYRYILNMGQHFAHVSGYSILNQKILFNSYNPYDGPNDNPELELPLTAGEYIYVYGDMDDDGFYEGQFEESTS